MRLFDFGGPKRCRYADRCRYYDKDNMVCQDDEEASTGKSDGSPYCGAFRRFQDFERNPTGKIEA